MVSVIIPVYNVESYLKECLNSVLAQTYTDLQIIVVDDGSTDESGMICDGFAAKDSRIQVVHQENLGLSSARNRGIELATGEYISFVDSDDYLLPEYIETLYKLCCDYNADMAAGSYYTLKNGRLTKAASRTAAEPELYTGSQKMDAYLRKKTVFTAAWGKLYAAGLLREIRFPPGKLFEDVYTTYLFVHAAARIILTQTPLYIYRTRPESITTSPYSNRMLDQLEACIERCSFIQRFYPDLLNYAQADKITVCNCLIIKMALSKASSRNAELQFRNLYKKQLFLYLKYGPSFKSKVFAGIAFVSIPTAKRFARWYMKWKR